jgi:hypothetical protein
VTYSASRYSSLVVCSFDAQHGLGHGSTPRRIIVQQHDSNNSLVCQDLVFGPGCLSHYWHFGFCHCRMQCFHDVQDYQGSCGSCDQESQESCHSQLLKTLYRLPPLFWGSRKIKRAEHVNLQKEYRLYVCVFDCIKGYIAMIELYGVLAADEQVKGLFNMLYYIAEAVAIVVLCTIDRYHVRYKSILFTERYCSGTDWSKYYTPYMDRVNGD